MDTLREVNRQRARYGEAVNCWNLHLAGCKPCQCCTAEHPDEPPRCADGARYYHDLQDALAALDLVELRSAVRS